MLSNICSKIFCNEKLKHCWTINSQISMHNPFEHQKSKHEPQKLLNMNCLSSIWGSTINNPGNNTTLSLLPLLIVSQRSLIHGILRRFHPVFFQHLFELWESHVGVLLLENGQVFLLELEERRLHPLFGVLL